jgi:hypothetical protein
MLQDVHSKKISIPVVAAKNATTAIVAAQTDAWIYIHELMGDLDVSGTITLLAGIRVLASFDLDAGQGLTLQDEPGMDGSPRFECRPGEAFNITMSAGSIFKGACDYSLRY